MNGYFKILNASLYSIGTLLRHSKNTALKSHEIVKHLRLKDEDLKYLIQSLDLCSNDLRLFPFTND